MLAAAGGDEKIMRHLQEDAGAIAGVDFAAAGAAVVEIVEYLQRLLDDRVRRPAFDVGDKADATRVVLVDRVVEALLGR